jgi:hypothetical protein
MNFIDYRLAIGMLVLADINVKFDKLTQTLVEIDGDGYRHPIVYCFRDGAIYKVKEETVDDYIEGHKTEKLRKTLGMQ